MSPKFAKFVLVQATQTKQCFAPQWLPPWNTFLYTVHTMGVYDFPMLEIGDVLGINTDFRINPNSILDTALPYILQWVMINYFGINTDLRIDPNSMSYPAKGG